MLVSTISEKDIKPLVSIHNLAFKDFFLTQLGDDFLMLYYSAIMKNKDGILLGYFDRDELYGFCAASTFSKRYNTQLIKENFISFGFLSIKLLVTKQKALIRLVNNLTKNNPSIKDRGDYAELLSIGVDPRIQGKGIGKKLILELEQQLKKEEVKQLSLTTDFYNNEKVIGFYKSLGYKIMYEFIAYPKRKMYRLIKEL